MKIKYSTTGISFFGWMLLTILQPNLLLGQNGQFRTPSFARAIQDKPAGQIRNAKTEVARSGDLIHAIRFGVRQFGDNQEQDPIQDWLGSSPATSSDTNDAQDQETDVEELPMERIPGDDSLQGAEEISPREQETGDSRSSSKREVIVQRYPDGKPQIEREVIQDEEGNYLNDGFWRVYSQQGQRQILAQGQYHRGVMEGIWMRKHAKNSSGLFATKPFTMFEGPFISIATFKNNTLDGLWTLQDAANQKMFEVPYREGKRHGTASWWYPSQTKMREVTFVDGVIHGRLREWDEQKKLVRDEEYVEGQKIVRNVTYYRPQQLETETYYLDAKVEVDGKDDWWRAEPAQLVTRGTRVQHGPVSIWYENGLPKMKGKFEQGKREGKFTWWHSNGQKQIEGEFTQGLKEGRWRWWHAGGMKAVEGEYKNDKAVGTWTWWDSEGKLEEQRDFGDGSSSKPEGSMQPEALPTIDSSNQGNPANASQTGSTSTTNDSNTFTLDLNDIDPSKSGSNREQESGRVNALSEQPAQPTVPDAADESSKTVESGENPQREHGAFEELLESIKDK